jgi:hypothetical protein
MLRYTEAKYRKVKNLYFERGSEIERLQNTLAHQRLAQSRTSLDDNEYTSRFERLDGAIKNVAFEIRQSWKTIPPWLSQVINVGAEVKGGREMTVVGRASISRWVVDEILELFFHPAVEANLSMTLKEIERNIRLLSPQPQTPEDDDALSTKVCNWRLTTLDALHNQINCQAAVEVQSQLAQHLVNKLVGSLQHHLHDPAPPGLLRSVQMVIDIAIGLAANLPIESRDVRVFYPMPGSRFDSKFMKCEGGLPPLTAGGGPSEPDEARTDNQSNNSGDTDDAASIAKDDSKGYAIRAGVGALLPQQPGSSASAPSGKDVAAQKKVGLSGKFKNALKGSASGAPPLPPSPGLQPPNSSHGIKQTQGASPLVGTDGGGNGGGGGNPPKQLDQDKIRIAGFMAVEVRGRSLLVKAPVWL